MFSPFKHKRRNDHQYRNDDRRHIPSSATSVPSRVSKTVSPNRLHNTKQHCHYKKIEPSLNSSLFPLFTLFSRFPVVNSAGDKEGRHERVQSNGSENAVPAERTRLCLRRRRILLWNGHVRRYHEKYSGSIFEERRWKSKASEEIELLRRVDMSVPAFAFFLENSLYSTPLFFWYSSAGTVLTFATHERWKANLLSPVLSPFHSLQLSVFALGFLWSGWSSFNVSFIV